MAVCQPSQKSLRMSSNWSYSKGSPEKAPKGVAIRQHKETEVELKPLAEVALSYQIHIP